MYIIVYSYYTMRIKCWVDILLMYYIYNFNGIQLKVNASPISYYLPFVAPSDDCEQIYDTTTACDRVTRTTETLVIHSSRRPKIMFLKSQYRILENKSTCEEYVQKRIVRLKKKIKFVPQTEREISFISRGLISNRKRRRW